MGKLTKLDEQSLDKVIELMLQGSTLKEAFRALDIKPHTFYKVLSENPLLASKYSHAQESRAELLADEIIDIADNTIDAQRARNMIDARRWYASKIKPNKYGDKIDVSVTHVDLLEAIREAKGRAQPINNSIKEVIAQRVNIAREKSDSNTGLLPVSDTIDALLS